MATPRPGRRQRRRLLAHVWTRMSDLRKANPQETTLSLVASVAADTARLLRDLARDPRVAPREKAIAAGAGAYLVSPLDVIPDVIPGFGQLDDLAIVAFALRRLLWAAGYEVVDELWQGSEEGLGVVLAVAGIE
jgi:uncharacterized membrane protein YkvA (DUF1232 family)